MAIRLKKKERRELSDSPVRRCQRSCYFFSEEGQGCIHFQKKEVKYGEACLFDIYKIKEYADAFADGNNDVIKRDASSITATLIMQLNRMLEEVNRKGVTVELPIRDAKGAVVYIPDPNWDGKGQQKMVPAMELKENPLIARIVQLAKSIGINLNDFKLTPKSADERAQVSGHTIIGQQVNLVQLLEERRVHENNMIEAIRKGSEMTKDDPVYKSLVADGEIKE